MASKHVNVDGGGWQIAYTKYFHSNYFFSINPMVYYPAILFQSRLKGSGYLICVVMEYVFQSAKFLDIVNKTAELDEITIQV
jgi:hypothetical protein